MLVLVLVVHYLVYIFSYLRHPFSQNFAYIPSVSHTYDSVDIFLRFHERSDMYNQKYHNNYNNCRRNPCSDARAGHESNLHVRAHNGLSLWYESRLDKFPYIHYLEYAPTFGFAQGTGLHQSAALMYLYFLVVLHNMKDYYILNVIMAHCVSIRRVCSTLTWFTDMLSSIWLKR